jgi:hypothetical protein
MNRDYLTLPSGSLLYEESVVRIKRVSDIDWIVRNCPYQFDNQTKVGWNLQSISGRLVTPLYEDDLKDLICVNYPNPIHKRYIPLKKISIEESDESEVHDV